MMEVYKHLEAEGIIGPYEKKGEQLVPRPFFEYPKMVTNKAGKRIRVQNLEEEVAAVGDATPSAKPDPHAAERKKIADTQKAVEERLREADELTAKLKAELAEVSKMRQPGANAKPIETKEKTPSEKPLSEAKDTDTSGAPTAASPFAKKA